RVVHHRAPPVGGAGRTAHGRAQPDRAGHATRDSPARPAEGRASEPQDLCRCLPRHGPRHDDPHRGRHVLRCGHRLRRTVRESAAMMTTFPHRSPWAPGQVLMQAGKVVLFMRLLCSLPVILSWADAAPSSFEIVLVCITTAISLLLILAWSTVIPFVMRHPSTVMADVCLSTALVAAGGTDSSYVAYLFCGALLVGMLFDSLLRYTLAALIISAFLAVVALSPGGLSATTGIGTVSLWAIIITVLVCVHMGAVLRTLQWRVDAAMEIAAQNSREAAPG